MLPEEAIRLLTVTIRRHVLENNVCLFSGHNSRNCRRPIEISLCVKLRELKLDGCRIDPLLLTRILAATTNLRMLSLAGIEGIVNTTIRSLSKYKSLRALNLSGTWITDKAINYISKHSNTMLEILLLTRTSFGMSN